MTGGGYSCDGTVPGSVYSFLINSGLMGDPYYRDNELKFLDLIKNDFTFSRSFEYAPDGNSVLLHCDGLDTLADIFVNGTFIGHTENMHRRFEFDVTDSLKTGENKIEIKFSSPTEYIAKMYENFETRGSSDAMKGMPHLRKCECMFGWDWGPRLPDAGIWRNISLLVCDSARITEFHITQRHENGSVFVLPTVLTDKPADVTVSVKTPSGEEFTVPVNTESQIPDPKLWWPNGLGEQPLYTFTASVVRNGTVCHSVKKNIGLRTLKLIREPDKYGESFCHEVNGIKFFAMGADYIPEDNILSRITRERTDKLISQCRDANFNTIRVWGGGFYPDDFFFDACDKYGIVVFLDMMFACCIVPKRDDLDENIRLEIADNLKRFRHHASIALICGNNEIESGYTKMYNEPVSNADALKFKPQLQYIIDLFEGTVRDIVAEVCPYIAYIPSSPTTCGHFINPQNENYGDQHFWEVWHGNKPFTEYRKHYFRYLSEFGFQSFPCEKTVNAFTEEKDRNIFSPIMERHQRNSVANGKIINYLSDTYRYPTDFGVLYYASQLLQAESIRYGVEHLRRNRGRCMGTLYWQLNDCWPVASWASIDYYGRYKALQYFAKRFFSPVLLSCAETGERSVLRNINIQPGYNEHTNEAHFYITNDTVNEQNCKAVWKLMSSSGEVYKSGEFSAVASPLSVTDLGNLDFGDIDVYNIYLNYALYIDGKKVCDEATLFCEPKKFEFEDPSLSYEINGDEITVKAEKFARFVEIYSPDSDFILSDNFIDINAGESRTVKILEGDIKTVVLRSVFDIK